MTEYKPLTNPEKEDVRELFSWGRFMKYVLEYRLDADGNKLTDDEILTLIDGESNIDLFHSYKYESTECEMCGSHWRGICSACRLPRR